MVDKAYAAFAEILARARDGDVPLVELRPRPHDETSAYEADFDFLFDPSRIEDVLRVIEEACVRHRISFRLSQIAPFKRRVVLIGQLLERGIALELWPHCELTTAPDRRSGYAVIPWRDVLAGVRAAGIASEDRTAIPGLVLSLLYVTHLYFKNKDLGSEGVRFRLDAFRESVRMERDCAQGKHADLCNQALNLLSALQDGKRDLRSANTEALRILKQLGIAPTSGVLLRTRRSYLRHHRRARWHSRRIVPVVGPDGSGKTTIIRGLANSSAKSSKSTLRALRFKKLFRGRYPYEIMRLRESRASGLPNNRIDEKITGWVLGTAWVSYMWEGLKHAWGGRNLTLMDRYFYDYMCTNVRDPEKPPRKIGGYRLLSKLVPSPRRLVVLTGSVENIRLRKGELRDISIETLRSVYREQILASRVEDVLFCTTDATVDESVDVVADFLNLK